MKNNNSNNYSDFQTPLKSQNLSNINPNNEENHHSTIMGRLNDTNLKSQFMMGQSKLYEQNHQKQQQQQQGYTQQQNPHHQKTPQSQLQTKLTQIQSQIHSIGQQLQSLHYLLLNHSDSLSKSYLELSQKRSILRKKLINLDYQHKKFIDEKLKLIRKQQEENLRKYENYCQNQMKTIQQERRKKESQRIEEMRRYEEEYKERIREIYQKYSSNKKQQKKQQVTKQQKQQTNKQSQHNQTQAHQHQHNNNNTSPSKKQLSPSLLAHSRRYQRIKQIQSQLSSSLHHSRISRLNAQRQYLQKTYLDPYYVYRPLNQFNNYNPYQLIDYSGAWLYY